MLRRLVCFILLFAGCSVASAKQPNILFAIADDWGWPHAGAYGDPVVKTPTFDRLSKEGVLFEHAFISSPSCTPSRGAILTGQWHWRLEGAGNLWSIFPDKFTTYEDIIRKSGYATGHSGKAWGPGKPETATRELAGKRCKNFQEFVKTREEGQPFCYWLGSSDPHRPYKLGSGKEAGMDVSKVPLPACYPDSDEIRSDIADYYFEVQRFDSLVGDALKTLEEMGELDNTLILMTGDHGMPFPRCKSNLYDIGSRVPLAARWGDKIKPGRVVTDFVSTTDFGPTFLDAVGLPIPEEMTGRSLMTLFQSDQSGRVQKDWNSILVGKERHVPSQESPEMGGYPSRGLRTDDYFLIVNFKPQRWPNGTPLYEQAAVPGTWYGDTDNGPTKSYIVANKDKDSEHRRAYELCFGKRPEIELYDLSNDPQQVQNVANQPKYQGIRKRLIADLMQRLKSTGDPRVIDSDIDFDSYPYLGGGPKHPSLGGNKNKSQKKK
ncbi:MAG: sulfatase [Planctomycetaceae bacterium]|nr:sulfatase [Planctomycetaceae bacterium]